MKKIISLSILLLLLSLAASSQTGNRKYRLRHSFNDGALAQQERMELRRDLVRYRLAEQHARRDGIVSPMERRRLHKIKCKARRDAMRLRRNNQPRVI